MTAVKPRPSGPSLRRSPPGVARVIEQPPLDRGAEIHGVGQSLFLSFRSELMRWHAQRARTTTPASEVTHG